MQLAKMFPIKTKQRTHAEEREGSVVKSLPPSLISLILRSHMVRILPHPQHIVCVKRKKKEKKEEERKKAGGLPDDRAQRLGSSPL